MGSRSTMWSAIPASPASTSRPWSEGELEALPAPVYARAFMRTYAQYLGLNAREFVSEMPGAKPEPELPPLPDVTREGRVPLVSPSWLVAGAVVVMIIIAGMVMFWNRSGDSAPSVRTGGPQVERPVGEGSDNPQPTAGAAGRPGRRRCRTCAASPR